MKKYIIIYILLLFTINNKAQNIDYFDNIVPPSPNVLALTKFGNIPVSYTTGIPQVSVPIYNYEDGGSGLKLDISLDYHAGGVRVDEMASNVGIGWSLNAGGVVSRTIRGIADEGTKGYWNLDLPRLETGNTGESYYSRPFYQMHAGEKDSQIDNFSYSINGRSGQFMWGKSNDLLIVKQEKLQISKKIDVINNRNVITEINIIDEKGFKYVFKDKELTTSLSSQDKNAYASAWYLNRIFSPSGKDSICLEYKDTDYEYLIGYNSSLTFITGYTNLGNTRVETNSPVRQAVKGKRISEIIFPNKVKAIFNYNTHKRVDLDDYALSSIVLDDGMQRRKIELKQDNSSNRLTLRDVFILDANGVSQEKYHFDYDGVLPDRLSKEQDHWGFANQNSGNLIQEETHLVGGKNYTLGTGNRKTHPKEVKKGSLKRIYYPTGGYTEFEMEANESTDPRLTREWTELIKVRNKSIGVSLNGYKPSVPQEYSFTYDGDDGVYTKYAFELSIPHGTNGVTPVAIFEIYSPENRLMLRDACSLSSGSTQYKTFEFGTALFKKGKHTIKTYLNGCECTVYGQMRWTEDISSDPIEVKHTSRELYVGGLRVRKISDYDGANNTPTMVREYEYILDGESSGSMGLYPTYSYKIGYNFRLAEIGVVNDTYFPNQHPEFLTSTSSPIFTLPQYSGSPVVYKKVRESTIKDGKSKGYTDYFFRGFGALAVDNQLPFTPISNRSWIYGLSDSIKIYNGDDELLQSEYNNYNLFSEEYLANGRKSNFTSLSLIPVKFGSINDNITWTPLYFLVRSFYPDEGRAELISKTIDKYESGKKMSTSTNYTYSSHNRQIISEKIAGSKGDVRTKSYFYTQDMIDNKKDPSNVYSGMIKQGMNGILIEQKEDINGTQIAHNRTNYYHDKKRIAYLPESYESLFDGKALPTILKCITYSPNTRIQVYSKNDNLNTILLWSYSGQYPIAEIKNATYADVNSALSTVGLTSIDALSANSSPDKVKLDKLRTLPILSNALVTTYKYQPLVGMLESTDPSGLTTYYQYDSFGRLMHTKDVNGKTIQTYDYHYHNQ